MMLQHGLSEDTSYTINQSLRFRASNDAYLGRTAGTPTNRNLFTISAWLKKAALSTAQPIFSAGVDDNNKSMLRFSAVDQMEFISVAGGTVQGNILSNAVFRDPSAHYHVLMICDFSNVTAASRILLYVNNTLLTVTTVNAITGTNLHLFNASGQAHRFARGFGTTQRFDGYLSEINFIDGQALGPSYFGQSDPATGIWVPKKYTGTYGNNGFYLPFNDATSLTTLGYDRSGNGNNWTCNGISVTAGVTYDVMKDSPTNGAGEVGNYCTLNPLKSSGATLSNGNLSATLGVGNSVSATIPANSGKWYFEAVPSSSGSSQVGVVNDALAANVQAGYTALGGASYLADGRIRLNNATFGTYATYTTNDVIGVAFDCDSYTASFYKNNSLQATVSLSSGLVYAPQVSDWNTGTAMSVNFGQRPFAYTPPTGFKALHTGNLSATTPVTTTGTFTGNASTDGPCIFINGTPTAMTINGNAVTFATHADKLAGGFKVRSSSASYNASGTNTYSITTNGGKFKYARAQGNP